MRRMMTAGLFVAGVLAVASFSDAQPPGGAGGPGGGQPPGGKGGKGGFGEKGGKGGMGGMATPGQILPAFIAQMLNLTDAQKKDLDVLQKDVDTKLDKLLTDDQKKQLQEMKDRGGKGGPGGPGGGFGGQKGGKGGPGGGEPPAKKP